MADEAHRKRVKIGVTEGGGSPPGYLWNVDIVDQSFDEAMSFLNEDQYEHLAAQFRELAALGRSVAQHDDRYSAGRRLLRT